MTDRKRKGKERGRKEGGVIPRTGSTAGHTPEVVGGEGIARMNIAIVNLGGRHRHAKLPQDRLLTAPETLTLGRA